MSGSDFRNKKCPCGSGDPAGKCKAQSLPCLPHEIYEAHGVRVDPDEHENFGGWPWGFALAAADEADCSRAELLAFMAGDHPHHRGKRLLFTASDPETKETYRFDTPYLVAKFHEREYAGMAGLVIRVPANRWDMEHKWTEKVYEELP